MLIMSSPITTQKKAPGVLNRKRGHCRHLFFTRSRNNLKQSLLSLGGSAGASNRAAWHNRGCRLPVRPIRKAPRLPRNDALGLPGRSNTTYFRVGHSISRKHKINQHIRIDYGVKITSHRSFSLTCLRGSRAPSVLRTKLVWLNSKRFFFCSPFRPQLKPVKAHRLTKNQICPTIRGSYRRL